MTEARSDALARAERRLAEVTGAIDAHAIVAEWNTDGRIRSVNDRFCVATQYSREELIGVASNSVVYGSGGRVAVNVATVTV